MNGEAREVEEGSTSSIRDDSFRAQRTKAAR